MLKVVKVVKKAAPPPVLVPQKSFDITGMSGMRQNPNMSISALHFQASGYLDNSHMSNTLLSKNLSRMFFNQPSPHYLPPQPPNALLTLREIEEKPSKGKKKKKKKKKKLARKDINFNSVV